MSKLRVIACGALLLSLVNGAYSAPPGYSVPSSAYIAPSIFSAPTVNDFLFVCRTNQSSCANEIGAAMMDKMPFNGTANICLSSTDYTVSVPAWLNAHPETHSMPTEDGIYLTLKKLYPCE